MKKQNLAVEFNVSEYGAEMLNNYFESGWKFVTSIVIKDTCVIILEREV